MSESEIETCGVAAPLHSSLTHDDSDVDFFGDGAADDIVAVADREVSRKASLRGRIKRQSIQLTGSIFACWLCANDCIRSHRWYKLLLPLDDDKLFEWWPIGGTAVVGLLICHFQLRSADECDEDPQTVAIHRTKRSQQSRLVGYVDYIVKNRYFFQEPWIFEQHNDTLEETLMLAHMDQLRQTRLADGLTVGECCASHGLGMPIHAWQKGYDECWCIMNGVVAIADSQLQGLRANIKELVHDEPKITLLKRFIKHRLEHMQMPEDDEPDHVKIFLHLPPQHVVDTKPRRWRRIQSGDTVNGEDLVKQLYFASFLRDTGDQVEGLEAALEVFCPNEEVLEATKKQVVDTHVCSPTAIRKGRLRLDAIGMSVDRRLIAEVCSDNGANVISAHVFSDGSPVTGTEIQGMALEIFVKDRPKPLCITLPGMSLMYGMMRTIDKAIAFLWALWLVAGPTSVTFTIILMARR